MKKIKKTVTVGLLSLCSTVCAAQSLNVLVDNPYTIKSVEEVSGAIYQWFEDGSPIIGATDASYTNTKASAGTYVYVRKAYKDGCGGWEASNAITVYVSGTPPDYTVAFSAFFPSADAPTGTVWYLTDTRAGGNNNTYKVRKMEDGHYWMVQDLKFGNCNDNSWYNDNSSVATNREPTVYASYFGHCRSSTNANAGYLYSGSATMQKANIYYGGWPTTGCLGTSGGELSPNPGYCRGICPTGWHVPTGTINGEFRALGLLITTPSINDFWFGVEYWNGTSREVVDIEEDGSGSVTVGANLHYWTSSDDNNQNLWAQKVVLKPAYNYYAWEWEDRNSGLAVRCVKNY
jgi:uncharacterized protein (TIGR02145 family)